MSQTFEQLEQRRQQILLHRYDTVHTCGVRHMKEQNPTLDLPGCYQQRAVSHFQPKSAIVNLQSAIVNPMTSQSYESQLTPDELHQLHAALTTPSHDMEKIQAEAPPWRTGPTAGSQPALKTLYKIAAQLRSERIHAEIETTNEIWQTAQADLLTQPAYSAASSHAINQIFSLICHEIIQKTLYREDSNTRIFLLRLLVRHQQLLIQKARFQRLAVEHFENWYQNGPAKEILEKLEQATYAERIEALGQAIFGEDWNPEVTQTDAFPELSPKVEPLPTNNEPPTTNQEPQTTNHEQQTTTEPLPTIAEPPNVRSQFELTHDDDDPDDDDRDPDEEEEENDN